jgi:hypothetical protein
MPKEFIKNHFENLKSQKKFDDGFISLLTESNETGEDGKITAGKILKLIKERYAQSKKNKT